jgi:hypothetical protein
MSAAGNVSGPAVRALHEEVPDEVVARAKSAFGRRAAPGTLATLSSDEDGEPRRLTFTHPTVWIEVRVVALGDTRTVSVRAQPSGPLTIERDEDPPTGPAPLAGGASYGGRRGDRVRVTAGAAWTEWFRL